MREVFTTFLRLGSTSFGGPVASRYPREPASSRVGMLIGLTRGGPLGAVEGHDPPAWFAELPARLFAAAAATGALLAAGVR